MLTIDEFRSAYRAADWRMSRRFILLFGGALVYLAVPIWLYGIVFGNLRDEHVELVVERWGTIWPIIAIVFYAIPAFILAYLSVHRWDRFLWHNPRLLCPNCGTPLKGLTLTIATQRCGHCFRPALVAPRAGQTANMTEQLPTIEHFNQAADQLTRRLLVRFFFVFVAGVIVLVFGGTIYRFMGYGPDSAMVGFFLAPGLVVLFAGMWTIFRLDQNSIVTQCRYCRNSLLHSRDVVVATRNCGHCGRRVLAEPDQAITAADSRSANSS
jgi:hypothetical protein